MVTIPPATSAAGAMGTSGTPADQEIPVTDTGIAETSPETAQGGDPLAKFGLSDLHAAVQSFAAFAPKGNVDPWLARQPPQGQGGAHEAGTPLYQRQTPPGGVNGPITAPARLPIPLKLAQLEALNAKIQAHKVETSPFTEGVVADIKHKFQGAVDALKAGDYKTAERAFRGLGFPLPPSHKGAELEATPRTVAIMLGAPITRRPGGGYDTVGEIKWGARGFQPLNDVDSFAANAVMFSRLSSLPGGVSNPPTEAQLKQYMQNLANPPKGTKPPTSQELMKAASEITHGYLIHYSSAGANNPNYAANPNQGAYYRDKAGTVHEFPSLDAAKQAAKAGKPPLSGKIEPLIAKSPDEWSDITSQGERAGRHIGDCESKLFLQSRLLTAAGFQMLGAVHVDPKAGGSGHMLGVFKSPDGKVWVTSNEEFRQVHARFANQGITQADVDGVVNEMTGELYRLSPSFRGGYELSDYRLSTSATANLTKANAVPTDTIRRSTELNQMGKSDVLIPPQKTTP